ETDIGRHVNRLQKHSSNDVRRLVKLLVRHVVASLTERSLCLIQNQSQCLVDLCGALHCDIEINFGLKKSKCNPAAAARNKHLCESLADSCFPVNDGSAASRLHVCQNSSCNNSVMHTAALEAGNLSPEAAGVNFQRLLNALSNYVVKMNLFNVIRLNSFNWFLIYAEEDKCILDRCFHFAFDVAATLLSLYLLYQLVIRRVQLEEKSEKDRQICSSFYMFFDAALLANMQTFPPSNAGGRRGQVYQPITAQTADLQLYDWTVFHLYLILFLSFVLQNYNTTSSFLASLQILLPCPCW
ncbi:hypothetical protein S83_063068, partial [Arachis hypogaea]